jgi:phenylpropionate dioxygenase-like ring-hydroxylating dioxygenase large terminal subunit
MATAEENALLTQTGPGTPAGELMRRYWQPVALQDELPIGGAPLPVRLLGEDLVLFRDDAGRPGLLAIHCAHRGADLSYGRLEDGGLRCIYHGWLYDIAGRCLEQPGEPAGSTFHERIRQTAYPCLEAGGMILAYLGPGKPPLLPRFEFLEAPDERRSNTKELRECNYLQGNEGNFDPQHLGMLHWVASGETSVNVEHYRKAPRPRMETEPTEFGVRLYTILPIDAETNFVAIHNFVMPNLSAFGSASAHGYGVNWHVPIDDSSHWVYRVQFERVVPIDKERIRRVRGINPDFRRTRTRANRYLQDRDEMKGQSFAGLGTSFPEQDACVTEGAGLIQDRTQEHLGYNDQCIVAARQMLLRAIRTVEQGGEAPLACWEASENRAPAIVAWSRELPASVDYRAYCKETERDVRACQPELVDG